MKPGGLRGCVPRASARRFRASSARRHPPAAPRRPPYPRTWCRQPGPLPCMRPPTPGVRLGSDGRLRPWSNRRGQRRPERWTAAPPAPLLFGSPSAQAEGGPPRPELREAAPSSPTPAAAATALDRGTPGRGQQGGHRPELRTARLLIPPPAGRNPLTRKSPDRGSGRRRRHSDTPHPSHSRLTASLMHPRRTARCSRR